MLPTASKYIKCSPNGTHSVDHTTSHHHKTMKAKTTNTIPKRLRKNNPTLFPIWMPTSAPVAPGLNDCMMLAPRKAKKGNPAVTVPCVPHSGALRTASITAITKNTKCTTFVRTNATASASVSSTRPTSSTRDRTRSDRNME